MGFYLGETRRREQTALAASGLKRCGTCHDIKPISAFGRSRRQPDGVHYTCRECKNAAGRVSYRRRRPAPDWESLQKHATLYAWLDPDSHEPVYIGKTTSDPQKRFQQQQREARRALYPKTPALRWLGQQSRRGQIPVIRPLAILTADEAGRVEREYAKRLNGRGIVLLNDPTAFGAGNAHGLATRRHRELEPYLALFPDQSLADWFGVSRSMIQKERIALGRFLHAKPAPVGWTPEMDAQLGTKPDAVIASGIGASFQQVAARRKRLGISSFRSRSGHRGELRTRASATPSTLRRPSTSIAEAWTYTHISENAAPVNNFLEQL
jgi:hypothetical protein